MMFSKIVLTTLCFGAIVLALAPEDHELQDRGKDVFMRRCSGCHAADINKEGPRLRGVYGRKAASLPGFVYSESLKKLDIHWDETTLDRWLIDPGAMAPDTDMAFRLRDSAERKAVIAYLKSVKTQ